MNEISSNRAFRIIIGSFVIVAAWKLWRANFFAAFMAEDSEGFSDPALVTLVVSVLLSSLELVGILAIFLCTSILAPVINPLADMAGELKNKLRDNLSLGQNEKPQVLDTNKLAAVLQGLKNRLDDIEKKVSGDD
tara:strand:- start:3112 stop:3516 length:405 start_codon:yes stop_codon:yes gene_type:complete